MVKINKRTATRFAINLQIAPAEHIPVLTFLDVAFKEEDQNLESNLDNWKQIMDEFNLIGSVAKGFEKVLEQPDQKKQLEYMETGLAVLNKWTKMRPYERYRLCQHGYLSTYILPSCGPRIAQSWKLARRLSQLIAPLVYGKKFSYNFYIVMPKDWVLSIVKAYCDCFDEGHFQNKCLLESIIEFASDAAPSNHSAEIESFVEDTFPRVWNALSYHAANTFKVESTTLRMVEYVRSMKTEADGATHFRDKVTILATVLSGIKGEALNEAQRHPLLNVRVRRFYSEREYSPPQCLTSLQMLPDHDALPVRKKRCIRPDRDTTQPVEQYEITKLIAPFMAVALKPIEEACEHWFMGGRRIIGAGSDDEDDTLDMPELELAPDLELVD